MEYHGYCVRINAHEGYGDKIRMLPANVDYEAIVGVLHKGATGENPHYHLVIKTQVRDQALRVRFRKIFNAGKGNQHMSIISWDGNIDAIAYLFHEDAEAIPVISHNVSEDTILKARTRNADVQVKVAKAKERASWRIEDELLEIYRTTKSSPGEHDIAKDIVLYALRRDKYIPNDFLLKGMARKIQFKLIDGSPDEEETFAKRMVATAYRMDYDMEREWMSAKGIYTNAL